MSGESDILNARSKNERLVLGFLRINGPISREEICQQTGLPNSTASYIMKRLRKKGLIIEEKGKSKTRGPKPIIVSINTKEGFVAGAAIYPTGIYVGIFTINLDLIGIAETPLKDIPTPEKASEVLKATLHDLLSKHHIPASQLIALGITLPGYALPDGTILNSSPLRWHHVPFKKNVSENFSCNITICRRRPIKVFVLEAFSDVWERPVILHITVGHGVGSTLITDGKINFGDKGLHGEIGHIIVEPNGPLCGCGMKGCLESLISGPAVAERIKNDIKNGVQTSLEKQIKKSDTITTIINLWGNALRSGDSYAVKIRDLIGEYFGRVAAIAITCYDPDTIILDGYVAEQCSEYLSKVIKEKIKTGVCAPEIRDIRIITAIKEDESYCVKIAAKEAVWELMQKT